MTASQIVYKMIATQIVYKMTASQIVYKMIAPQIVYKLKWEPFKWFSWPFMSVVQSSYMLEVHTILMMKVKNTLFYKYICVYSIDNRR